MSSWLDAVFTLSFARGVFVAALAEAAGEAAGEPADAAKLAGTV